MFPVGLSLRLHFLKTPLLPTPPLYGTQILIPRNYVHVQMLFLISLSILK